ncbi:MAG: cytochrome C [Planctomycetes bacterium]|nr:cytochrome C [Planctomycetota bacterium]
MVEEMTSPLPISNPPIPNPKSQIPNPPPSSPFAPPPAPSMPAPHSTGSAPASDQRTPCEFIADCQYPSAEACRKCHQRNYDEWSVSSHAYATISPMFHKFEQKINDLSLGTIGYFCYRCHSPVGTTLGISRAAPLWDLPPVAREGVTCVVCHRVNERFGKVNGERRIEPGDIHAPVYGPIGGSGVAEVIANANQYKVKTSPHDPGPGQDIHAAGVHFDQLSKSEFCSSCHQVAVHPGIKLEVVWEQYRASPACKKGVSCQDCHMGRIPGVKSGYAVGPAAKVNDLIVNPNRKHANHTFYGPGYSIAHPGIFPHNPKARRWSIPDWLMFDHRAGWGTEAFEELLASGRIHASFPPAWIEVDDRYDAREIIEENLKKLDGKKNIRIQLMENGSHVDGPYFDTPLNRGRDLRFHYVVTNTNEGHNFPSGSLGAQPQLWANVVLIGPRGQRLWESGYTDRWGDVADIHSDDVRNKRIPFDHQLFNLQTMFLITGAKGTDREFFLPVNIDFDQLPYLRPGAQPISVINHPPFIRMESRSIAPLGSRRAPYKIPAQLLQEPGCYRLSFRLRSRAEPIYFMRFVGATREMQRAMNEGMIDFHQSSVEFIIR